MIKGLIETLGDRVIGACNRVMRSKTGDQVKAVRIAREAARAVNDLMGQPICAVEERRQRRIDREKPVPMPPSLFRRNPTSPPV